MDLELDENQTAIAELALQILRESLTRERLRAIEASSDHFAADEWRKLATAGLLGVPLAEDVGGGGFGIVEACVVLEQVGKTVAPLPYLSTVVGAAMTIDAAGSAEQRNKLLPRVVDGSLILATALAEDGDELAGGMHTADRSPEGLASGAQAIFEMMSYANGIRATKREHPANDIASTLLAAEVDGEKLTDLEFDMFFLLLINAGGDTTRNLVAGGMLELLRRPDALRTLRDEPRLLPGAIEELLRFCSPVVHFRRTATRDTVLGGQPIAAGEKVVVFYASANRDASVFPDADMLDIARSPNEHVAFGGGGVHFCLGANLARVEIRAMFAEVLSRLHDVALAGPVERLRSNFINGPRHMPVRFRAS